MKIELLQKYIFISLDIFSEMHQNVCISNKLEEWLTFLCIDSPDDIIRFTEKYPEFKKMYDEIFSLCLNTEKVMDMFSKELAELDKNTVMYMMDEMQAEIDSLKEERNACIVDKANIIAERNELKNLVESLQHQLEQTKL